MLEFFLSFCWLRALPVRNFTPGIEHVLWFVGLGAGGEESDLVTTTGGKRPHLARGALSWAQVAKGREAGDSPHQILLTALSKVQNLVICW